ncbi:MAG: mechanosensitive ion channel family protein [Syntrophomonas sp.]
MEKEFVIPAAIIISSIIVGFAIEKLFSLKLIKIAEKSSLKIDDIIVNSFRGMIFLWFVISGVYFTLLWSFNNAGWINQVIKILVSIAIISVTVVVMRITSGLINSYSQTSEGIIPSISIFENLIRILILVIGVLVMLQYLGISITPILTALGVGGIAVALALQDTLSNTFAGIHILLSRQIKPGNYIRLDSGQEGFVTDISWRNTSIRMMSNNMVLIPNLRLSNAIVTNHELPENEMTVPVNVGVSYSSDLEKVEKTAYDTAREVLQEVPGGVPESEPLVRFHTFSDSSIDLTVYLRVKSFPDQFIIKHEFIKRLYKRFNEAGIEIPFPIRTLYLKK